MYRGMHFLTDVLFGAALGAACIVGAAVIVPRAASRRRAEL
jgi:membrane-associated phospholipid phosphatase